MEVLIDSNSIIESLEMEVGFHKRMMGNRIWSSSMLMEVESGVFDEI